MQKIINDAGHLRPVRMVRVGQRKAMTPEEQRFIRYAKQNDVPVVFHKPNPKRKGTGSHARYSKYFVANTLKEAGQLGMTSTDLPGIGREAG
jgi:predicted TIM-barrel fold metal-dependent hydrolase